MNSGLTQTKYKLYKMAEPLRLSILPDIKLPRDRDLFFSEQVDQKSIVAISRAITEINKDDDELVKLYSIHDMEYVRKPIRIFIDSYGGQCYSCLGLLGIMGRSKTTIHTIAVGAAMSCGFLILISGHRRFGYEYCTPLYHQVSSWERGTIQDLKEGLVEVERLQSIVETITIKRTSISQDKLKDVREKKIDWYMSADDALKLNVIDEII